MGSADAGRGHKAASLWGSGLGPGRRPLPGRLGLSPWAGRALLGGQGAQGPALSAHGVLHGAVLLLPPSKEETQFPT